MKYFIKIAVINLTSLSSVTFKLTQKSYPPAIINFRDQIPKRHIRHFRLLVQIHNQILQTSFEIGVHPLILNIPPNRAELSPLQNNRVEKGEGEQEPLELVRLRALFISRVLEVAVGSRQIGLEPARRLVGQFNSRLQNRHWEPICRHRSQPEPVIRVRVGLHLQLLDPLQLREPRDGQVAVLQDHPAAVSPAGFDVFLGDVALALSEGQLRHPAALHFLLLCELVEVGHRVRARGQNENDRGHAGRVEEGVREVEFWGLWGGNYLGRL